jgi:hypothetical protein
VTEHVKKSEAKSVKKSEWILICAAIAAGHAVAYDTVEIADAMRDPQPNGA